MLLKTTNKSHGFLLVIGLLCQVRSCLNANLEDLLLNAWCSRFKSTVLFLTVAIVSTATMYYSKMIIVNHDDI